jgi:hypothetical protein
VFDGDVLGFRTGKSYSALLLESPADHCASQNEHEAACGLPGVDVTGPISIHEATRSGAVRTPTLEDDIRSSREGI